MLNLLVFAVIGLLVGSAARLFYPGRQALHIFGTLLLGMIGAVVGGMFSWNYWPASENQFDAGNLRGTDRGLGRLRLQAESCRSQVTRASPTARPSRAPALDYSAALFGPIRYQLDREPSHEQRRRSRS